jgi:hypothetical protein
MPSSQLLHGVINRPLGEETYQARASRPNEVMISVISPNAAGPDCLGVYSPALASATYPATTRALGFMFALGEAFTVQKVWWANGTTATTDNADVAVYDEAGTSLLVSGGSTAIATANVIQEKDCTDTVLAGGARYWCVYNQSGVTATPLCFTFASVGLLRVCGVAQFAGAVPLGATFTPAANASAIFPYFGIAGRTQVA